LRRELLAYFFSPIAWVVLALFLVLEGFQFVLFVKFLAQPAAPHGEVMQYLFGGTLLFWVGTILLSTLLPMRLLAEERRTGTLEALLTAPVTPTDVVVGKWLAAWLFYLFLWVPTLTYVAILYAVAPAGGGPDPGTVLTTYLGVALIGGAFVAVGLCASAPTSNQVIAAVSAFIALLVLTLLGVLSVFPTTVWEGRVLSYLNLIHHMEDLARGVIDSRPIVYLASITLLALAAAVRLVKASEQGRRQGAIELALLTLLCGMVNYLASRHYVRGDLTRAQVHALSPKTISLLQGLDLPIDVYVFMAPGDAETAALAGDVREILERMQSVDPSLTVRWVDKDESPEEARRLKGVYRLSDDDLARGVVVFAVGDRSRFVSTDDMADYRDDQDTGVQRIADLKAEGAFDGAILAVTRARTPRACFTAGHDELGLDPQTFQGDYGSVARSLSRDEWAVEVLDAPLSTVPDRCDVLVVGGPKRAFGPDEAAALDGFLGRGGHAFVLYDDEGMFDDPTGGLPANGLEDVLERWGVRVRPAIAVDPTAQPQAELPAVWMTAQGYGSGPIGRALAGRQTRHTLARVLEPAPRDGVAADVVVETSAAGWGEGDAQSLRLEAPVTYDPAVDLKGPVAIGVATQGQVGGARLVVFGDALSYLSRVLDAESDYNGDLFLSACAWLIDEPRSVQVGAKVPEQVRLELTDTQVSRIETAALGVLPLLALAFGLAMVLARARGGARRGVRHAEETM
jgi:ABC-2 type transport system permease protein